MPWFYLILAGLCEVVWAIGLKKTEGLTRFLTDPSKIPATIMTIALMLISFWLLSLALRDIPLGTAYGVWTGIGAVGTVIYGMIFLNEAKDALRIGCILMIIAGIVGLKLVSKDAV